MYDLQLSTRVTIQLSTMSKIYIQSTQVSKAFTGQYVQKFKIKTKDPIYDKKQI